jgi:hypothetical protein
MRLRSRRPLRVLRRCRSSRLKGWSTQEEQLGKMEGQGGGEAQGVADPKNLIYKAECGYVCVYVPYRNPHLWTNLNQILHSTLF